MFQHSCGRHQSVTSNYTRTIKDKWEEEKGSRRGRRRAKVEWDNAD